MMPEKKRAPYRSGRGKGDVSQIQGHLCDKTADELLTDLEAKIDEMTDLTYDEDIVDSYLAALDKKAPLEGDFNVEQSWDKFRSKYAALFDEVALPELELESPPKSSHKNSFRRTFLRVVVVAAIVAVLSIFGAQAAGVDVLGAIGRWTKETFRFVTPTVSTESVKPISESPGSISDIMQYQTIQDAFHAHSITAEQLIPSKIPDGYTLQYVDAFSLPNQIVVEASYGNDSGSGIGMSYTYWETGNMVPSIVEKDGADVIEYQKNGITHYILSNENIITVTWINGSCECVLWSDITLEELLSVVDTIYQ